MNIRYGVLTDEFDWSRARFVKSMSQTLSWQSRKILSLCEMGWGFWAATAPGAKSPHAKVPAMSSLDKRRPPTLPGVGCARSVEQHEGMLQWPGSERDGRLEYRGG